MLIWYTKKCSFFGPPCAQYKFVLLLDIQSVFVSITKNNMHTKGNCTAKTAEWNDDPSQVQMILIINFQLTAARESLVLLASQQNTLPPLLRLWRFQRSKDSFIKHILQPFLLSNKQTTNDALPFHLLYMHTT